MDKALASDGFHLVSVCENLADKIWENRPAKPDDEIVVHPITYSGKFIMFKFWKRWKSNQ